MDSITKKPNEPPSRTQTILIIDDEINNLGVLSTYLEEVGYQVLVARDGESGLEKARYARPDLVLLDVILPGIDGFETCRRLKANKTTEDIPVIFITILEDTADKVKGFAAGSVDYIPKPFQEEEVLARVTTHLRLRSLARDLEEAKTSLERQVEARTNALQISEARYREQARQMQDIIDTVPEGVLLLSAEAEVQMTNPTAEKYLALLAPDWRYGRLTHLGAHPLNDLLTSPPKGLWHDVSSSGQRFEVIARPVENGPSNQGWVLVLRDITQERIIQRRVQEQERLAAVGQLAAGIAHDFNNILAVIALYAQITLRTATLAPRVRERMQTIEQQANRASDLIEQILDFSRQSIMDRQPLDLLSFLNNLIKLLKRTLPENIHLELIHTEDAYMIFADSSRLQQVFMNLAFNARDAMPEGGDLTITLDILPVRAPSDAPLPGMGRGKWIQIVVTDSGMGIPSELLARIFEPFFTTKEVGQGTGLGLAQVYGIVQQHQGLIDVQSKAGQGTTFLLYFPAYGAEWQEVPEIKPYALPKGEGQTILLVEDEMATRQALAESLTILNYKVIEAGNGREALSLLQQHSSQIDLILSDAIMPEMGGTALLHSVRELELDIPFVIITGHVIEKDMEALRTQGLHGWLVKPPDLSDLASLLAQLLAR
ncbi:MAG: response regulator [Anaerolineaceae bacterium]|nr:response regulator [Anaerolineaceae bacterium]